MYLHSCVCTDMCMLICLRGCVSVCMWGYACLCVCEWLRVYCIKLDCVIWEVQDLLCYNHVDYSVILISNITMYTQFLDKCSHCGRREHILERRWMNPSKKFCFPQETGTGRRKRLESGFGQRGIYLQFCQDLQTQSRAMSLSEPQEAEEILK